MEAKHNDYRVMYIAQDGNCFYCQRPLQPKVHKHNCTNGWTRDHFKPKSGGNTLLENTVLSCHKCNTLKGHQEPDQDELLFRFSRLQENIKVVTERLLFAYKQQRTEG